MAVIYRDTLKTTRLQSVLDDIGTAGVLEIANSTDFAAGNVLAAVPLANPAGTLSVDVLTFTMPQSDTDANNTGTAAQARITDGTNPVITGLTVTGIGGGGNIELDSLSISTGQTVEINSATITHG